MENKKNILIFSLVYYPNFIGGAEVAVKEITDRLATNFNFDMITLRLDKNLPKVERIGNVTVYRVGFSGNQKVSSDSLPFYLHFNKYLMPFSAFYKAVSLSRKKTYDLTWSIMASYNSFAALFFKILNPKIPFLLTLQEGDPIPYIKKRVRFVWWLFKMIFKRANGIQAISNYLLDFGRDMKKEKNTKCHMSVVPNGVDVAFFSKSINDSEIELWKKKIEKNNGEKFIVTSSRLVEKNAVGDIIKSLAFLDSNIKLAIAGIGYEEQKLHNLAKELGVDTRVVFLGHVSHKDMPKLLKVSDVFVRPSLSEGFGNSFVEAMATKIPVVATPVGGIVDFLVDGETGLFCKVRDPESIAQKVKIFLENENICRKVVEQAFKMVEERYDWSMISEQMKKIFLEL